MPKNVSEPDINARKAVVDLLTSLVPLLEAGKEGERAIAIAELGTRYGQTFTSYAQTLASIEDGINTFFDDFGCSIPDLISNIDELRGEYEDADSAVNEASVFNESKLTSKGNCPPRLWT